jgi:hypothetical protein
VIEPLHVLHFNRSEVSLSGSIRFRDNERRARSSQDLYRSIRRGVLCAPESERSRRWTKPTPRPRLRNLVRPLRPRPQPIRPRADRTKTLAGSLGPSRRSARSLHGGLQRGERRFLGAHRPAPHRTDCRTRQPRSCAHREIFPYARIGRAHAIRPHAKAMSRPGQRRIPRNLTFHTGVAVCGKFRKSHALAAR